MSSMLIPERVSNRRDSDGDYPFRDIKRGKNVASGERRSRGERMDFSRDSDERNFARR